MINHFISSQYNTSEEFPEALCLSTSDNSALEEKKDPPSPICFTDNELRLSYLLVGKKKLAAVLQKQFDELGLSIQTVHDPLRWSRDARVYLPDGTHLIPAFFPHQSRRNKLLFQSLLPEYLLHFYFDDLDFTGQGFTKKFRQQAIDLAQQHRVPYKEGKTCIEGGNCHIFTASDGKPKAIIGYTSLILSFICLYNQQYFEKQKDRIMQSIPSHTESLSKDFIRIAKNLKHFICKEPYNIDEYVGEKPSAIWTQLALQTREMIEITKEVISEELMIPAERIAYIFQTQFHIDMEVFVGPNDAVFIHDEAQMLALQKRVDIKKMPFLQRTLNFSNERLKQSQILLQENTKILKSIDCQVIPVPGVLTASYHAKDSLSLSHINSFWTDPRCQPFAPFYDSETEILKKPEFPCMLNFMNGIFLKPNLFITTSAPDHPITSFFQNMFQQKVKEACPELNLLFIKESLPKILICNQGALRCLTSEL